MDRPSSTALPYACGGTESLEGGHVSPCILVLPVSAPSKCVAYCNRHLQVLKEVTISDPRIPVYSNATAEPVSSAADVAALLAQQLVEPVQWEATLRALVATGKTEMVRFPMGLQSAKSKRADHRIGVSIVMSRSCCESHCVLLKAVV